MLKTKSAEDFMPKSAEEPILPQSIAGHSTKGKQAREEKPSNLIPSIYEAVDDEVCKCPLLLMLHKL